MIINSSVDFIMELRRFLVAIVVFVCVNIVNAQGEWSHNESVLAGKCKEALDLRQFRQLSVLGGELEKLGIDNGNSESHNLGMAFSLYGEVMSYSPGNPDRLSQKICDRLRNGHFDEPLWVKSYMCLAVACYYNIYEVDFSKSVEYALKALEYAKKGDIFELEVIALGRLAYIYCDRKDPAGIQWAAECERLALKINNVSSLYMVNANMASYLYHEGKYDLSKMYIDKADSIAKILGMAHERYYIDSFRGELYNIKGDYKRADSCFQAGLRENADHTPFDRWYANASYALFLDTRKKYEEAVYYYEVADKAIEGYHLPSAAPGVYLRMAEAIEALGRHKEALEIYKKYNRLNTERMTSENEKYIKELEVKYKVAEQNNINNIQRIEIIKKNKTVTVATSLCIVFIILAGALASIHIFTLKYYKRIVKVNLAALSREKHLRHELSAALDKKRGGEEKKVLKVEDRFDEIYVKINDLIEKEHVHRNPDISLDSLAMMVGTNRTYLQQVIKQKTGMTYSAYINELRINDAIEQLSSSTSKDIVKTVAASVGFESASNFYRLFKKKTGVSPAVFRQQSSESIGSPDKE